MRRSIHGKDGGAKFKRRVGKLGTPSWKLMAVAKCAPGALDDASEDTIRQILRERIREKVAEEVAVSISFDDGVIYWLVIQARNGVWQAQNLLRVIKSLPDEIVLRKVPTEPYARALGLELKRFKKNDGGSHGQKRLREILDSYIVEGYEAAAKVLEDFLK